MRSVLVAAVLMVGLTAGAAPKKHEPGALVLILDRSGSMQGVKLDATKEAARVAVEMLDPTDQVAIVVFDSEATVHVPLQPAANKTRIGWEVAKLTAGGGTAFLPALQLATSILAGAKVKVKHTILMSDGEAPADGVIEQVKKMREAKITISTVGLQGADRNLLNAISDGGVGRLYMVNDLVELPKIFAKEISTAIP